MTREEILKNIKSCTCGYDRCDECTLKNATGFTCIDELLTAALRLIKNQPEIIRCKECKYCDKDSIIMSDIFFCRKISTEMGFDDYCSYAERKEDDERNRQC